MTNAELIDELRGHILSVPLTLLRDAADALEAAEAQLPKEGEWIELSDRNERKYSHICSNCHRFNIHEGEIEFYHYCPNCGAKMQTVTDCHTLEEGER